jgi:SH3-like domain-containing protein
VLVDNGVTLRKGNGDGFEPAFVETLGPGVESTVIETRPGWLRIELPDGRSGWIRESQAAQL